MSHDPTHLSREPSQLRSAVRCGAKTRSGRPCQAPAVAGRARCRMHGGAKGSGGPRGRRNGNYKHGRYTAEARDWSDSRAWSSAVAALVMVHIHGRSSGTPARGLKMRPMSRPAPSITS
jgi:hypothetical protein